MDEVAIKSTNHQELTLDNGLRVVWEQDSRQLLVAVEVRIAGGLRGEGKYVGSGITHFIEHMLFKGTPSRLPGSIDKEVRSYGGTINAFTSHDYTGINLFVESKFLPKAIEMLSDILQNATFPEDEFLKERSVILSEIHMNRDDPDRRLNQIFWDRFFMAHPYRYPILGYDVLLEGLNVEDLRSLYRQQYVPNNVVISCVGDIDTSSFPDLVKNAFGKWKRSSPYQINLAPEPKPAGIRRVEEGMSTLTSYTIIGFPSVRLSDPDLYPLDVLSSIIGDGRSSRLHEELVRNKKIAQVAAAANYTPLDNGAFTIYIRTEPEKTQQAIDASLEVVENLASKGISMQELEKSKRRVVSSYIFNRQTIDSKAEDFASSLAMTGDATFSLRYVEGIKNVSAESVKEVARKYLDRNRMTVATVRPLSEKKEVTKADSGKRADVKKTVLPNGLTLLISVDRHLPMAVIVAASKAGVRVESESNQGISNLVAQMLTKGTAKKSASEIAEFVESRGGVLEPFSGRDGFGILLQVLNDDLEEGLSLASELLTQSSFPEEEMALQKSLIIEELKTREDDIFYVASRLLRKTLFVAHPYRFEAIGTKESIEAISRSSCIEFAKQRISPDNLILSVFGDMDPEFVRNKVSKLFGNMPKKPDVWPAKMVEDRIAKIKNVSQHLDKEQSVIMFGFNGVEISSPDRYSLDVLTAILSGMSGRLFQSVREKQGLSYTLGAVNVPGWDPGYLLVYAATKPKERQHATDTILNQLNLLSEEAVGDEELDQAKRYLIGHHRLELQNLSGLAKRATVDELYGLGYDAWTTYENKVNSVTPQMLKDVAKKYLDSSAYVQVLAGPEGP